MAEDYSSAITIEEIGPGGRSVVLTGSALPIAESATWGQSQKVVTKWFPGNGTDAVQQVLGARLAPGSYSGHWSRQLLGRSPVRYADGTGSEIQVVEPYALREIFEDLAARGRLIRMTFEVETTTARLGGPPVEDSMRVVREGRISGFVARVQSHAEISWDLTVEWKGKGPASTRIAPVRDDSDLARAVNAYLRASDTYTSAIQGALRNPLKATPTVLTLGRAQALLDTPGRVVDRVQAVVRSNVNAMRDATTIGFRAATLPLAIYAGAVSLVKSTASECARGADDIVNTPSETFSRDDDVASQARAYVIAMNEAAAMERLGETSTDTARAIEPRLATYDNRGANGGSSVARIRGMHVAKAGETLSAISLRWYGTIDRDLDIARANKLPWDTVTVPAGTPLVIPVVGGA